MSDKQHIAGYAATVFLTSAFLLVLEIVAGRIIAPYVGVSLYSWTSIIGVILAGLSLGNWIGGRWADRGASETSTGIILIASGISCFAILFFLKFVTPAIHSSEINILTASFLYALSLFFIPAMLLGVITPILTVLALRIDKRSGHIVGMMNALAAFGSIVGTFITGYWLIQHVGTYKIIIGCGIALLLLSIPYLINSARKVFLFSLLILSTLIGVSYLSNAYNNPCLLESQYYCIRIKDQSQHMPFGQARTLILDNLSHGTSHQQAPKMLIENWIHLMDELSVDYLGNNMNVASFFFAGGGSYTHPRAIKAFSPRTQVTVAEIDPWVTKTVKNHLYYNASNINIIHMDARVALGKQRVNSFDVIVGDVFHDISVPYHLTTKEYNKLVKSRLKPGGLYLLNVVDTHPDPLLVKSIHKTLSVDFKHVHILLKQIPDSSKRTTYVITASDTYKPPVKLNAKRGFRLRNWQRVTQQIINNGIAVNRLPVLSDRFAPVEKLVSRLLF